MTREQVIKNRNTFSEFGPYQLILDNEVRFMTGIDKRVMIFDDENELVYEISSNTCQYHNKTDKEIRCSGYDTIQYFAAYVVDSSFVEFLNNIESENVIDNSIKNEIIEKFKFKK